MDECIIQAENASSVFDQVMFYTLSSTPEVGLRIGLDDVKCEQFRFVYLYITTTPHHNHFTALFPVPPG